MPAINQQSSILSEQELQLLASDSNKNQQTTFKIYSYQYQIKLVDCQLHLLNAIEQLILMLSASPRGVAVLLPAKIESEPTLDKLVNLLTHRADIRVFWLGQLPSMETNLPVFVHCADEHHLHNNINLWKNYITRTFSEWLANYAVAFITEDEEKKQIHQKSFAVTGLRQVKYFDSQSALTAINKPQLLIIDIDIIGLRLIDILKRLSNLEQFPIIIIYGQLPSNVCRAAYSLIENQGFPLLASLTAIPNEAQWNQLFSSLFSQVYLKHWVSEEQIRTGAYPIYDLEIQSIISYFCLYGITKEQIATLEKPHNMRHIINIQSLQDWFPEGIKREIRGQLADDLKCDIYNIDICIEHPEKIQPTSILFSTLVMARLSKAKIYWFIENEFNLLTDIVKNFPISDVILSESLSNTLLTDPCEILLEFLEQAQQQQVNIIACLQPSRSSNEALALYGITTVLNKQSYIE